MEGPRVTVGVPGPGVAVGETLADGEAEAEALGDADADADAVTDATEMTVPFAAVGVTVVAGAAALFPLSPPPLVRNTAAARIASTRITPPPAIASSRVPPVAPASAASRATSTPGVRRGRNCSSSGGSGSTVGSLS